MTDREKIINAIEKAKKQSEEYAQDRIIVPFKEADMILALLKEPEAVEPKVIRMNDFGHPVHACGKCGLLITESMNYCHECGKRIDWESR